MKIKFRCWHKEVNKMFSWEELLKLNRHVKVEKNGVTFTEVHWPSLLMLDENNSDFLKYLEGEPAKYLCFCPGVCDFMLYTGLFDDKNNEICEGDILKIYEVAGNVNIYGQIIKIPPYHKVSFEFGKFMANYLYYPRSVYNYILEECTSAKDGSCEIIGNIYENPQLLEKNICEE